MKDISVLQRLKVPQHFKTKIKKMKCTPLTKLHRSCCTSFATSRLPRHIMAEGGDGEAVCDLTFGIVS